MAPLFKCADVSVSYGGVTAVRAVDLQLNAGVLHGLIGPNGSGKSTLLAAMSKLAPLSTGRLWLDGDEYTKAPSYEVARRGVGRTFQNVRLIRSMDVLGNVMLGADRASRPSMIKFGRPGRRADHDARDRAMQAIEQVGLTAFVHANPVGLPYGTQRRVEIARSIAMSPKLLLLDEPTAGMREDERTEIMDLALRLVKSGMSILLVEHNLRMINELCETLFVMDTGSCIARGAPDVVMRDPAVRAAYLGEAR